MDQFSLEELGGLGETGFSAGEPTRPEDEMFHAVYIAGTKRTNDQGIVENPGMLQIRGVEYNLESVHMIITHVKQVLAKMKSTTSSGNPLLCFSYKQGSPPWYGNDKIGNTRECGVTSAERAADDWCKECRAQLIVSGIYCKSDGTPIKNEDGSPIYVFIRGKGMKYSNVSDYLSNLSKMELTPLITPVTEDSIRFEKSVLNNKRFVTDITTGTASSRFGEKIVFELATGTELDPKVVNHVVKLAQNTLEDFNKKFHWKFKSKSSFNQQSDQQTTPRPSLDQMFAESTGVTEPKKETPKKIESEASSGFELDGIDFGDL